MGKVSWLQNPGNHRVAQDAGVVFLAMRFAQFNNSGAMINGIWNHGNPGIPPRPLPDEQQISCLNLGLIDNYRFLISGHYINWKNTGYFTHKPWQMPQNFPVGF